MKLIKLPQDHYIVVDDSQIKEGDYVLSKLNEVEVFGRKYTPSLYKKITHTTQPLGIGWQQQVKELSLYEVKELLGEVDVEKKYTKEDVIRIVEKSRETGLTAEYLLLSLQSKTEWEVEIENGKLKLV